MLKKKFINTKLFTNVDIEKIFTAFAFPRALPLRLGESTFTVPRPSLKPSKKGPLQAIYI